MIRNKRLLHGVGIICITIIIVFMRLQMPSTSFASSFPDLFKIKTHGTTATLYFVPVSGQNSGYYVSYGFHANAEDYGVYFNDSDTSGVTTYAINNLFPGTWYFKVHGQNGSLPGLWSNIMKVKITNSWKKINTWDSITQTLQEGVSIAGINSQQHEEFGWYPHNGQSMQYVNGNWYATPFQYQNYGWYPNPQDGEIMQYVNGNWYINPQQSKPHAQSNNSDGSSASSSGSNATSSLPLITSAFFNRKDLIYGSEIGSWEVEDGVYDGQYMLNYDNSCPTCALLATQAEIPIVRWAVWDTFSDMTNPDGDAGTMTTTAFNNVINGIRSDLHAYPLIKLQPIQVPGDGAQNFCPSSWGVSNLIAMDEEIIRTAGSRVQLYEIANEPDLDCSMTGTDIGNYWDEVAPVLKAYARSLGFEIYIGGPAMATTHINAATDTQDELTMSEFLSTIYAEYNNSSDQYYHDADLIPSFVSFHSYAVEYTTNVGGSSTVLDAISHYGQFVDNVKFLINNIWGDLGTNIITTVSEWNIGTNSYSFPSPTSAEYYTQFLQMLRAHNVGIADQFLMASNGDGMDMITEQGTSTPYYTAFQQQSVNDSLANASRKGNSSPYPTPGSNYVSTIESDSPIALWRLGEKSGTTADNTISASYSGTYENSPTLGQASPLLGDPTTAVTFNGTNSYVSIPYNAALNTNGSFSVELWVNPTNVDSDYQGVVASRFSPDGWIIYLKNDNEWSFWVNQGTAAMLSVTDPNTVTANTWYHIIATFNGTTADLYVDGILVASGTASSTYVPNASEPLTIGQGTPGNDFFFQGTISNVSLYNVALTQTQVSNHFEGGIY